MKLTTTAIIAVMAALAYAKDPYDPKCKVRCGPNGILHCSEFA